MSFKAILHIPGQDIVLDYVDLELNQSVDARSRPASMTRGGIITVEFDTPSNGDMIADWASNPIKQLDGSITYMNQNQDSIMKTINFYNAYCIEFMERFDGTMSDSNMKTTIKISPERVNIGGVEHDNNWFVHGTSQGAGAEATIISSGIARKEGTEFEKGTIVEPKKKEPVTISRTLSEERTIVEPKKKDPVTVSRTLSEEGEIVEPKKKDPVTVSRTLSEEGEIVEPKKKEPVTGSGTPAKKLSAPAKEPVNKAKRKISGGAKVVIPKLSKKVGKDGLTSSQRRRQREKNGQKSRQSEYPHGNKKKQDAFIDRERKKSPDGKCRDMDGNIIEGNVTIEHNKPVAEHWNEKGYDQTREERTEFYNDEDNWSLKGASENSSEGSKVKKDTGGYRQDTGPNYTAKRAKKSKK